MGKVLDRHSASSIDKIMSTKPMGVVAKKTICGYSTGAKIKLQCGSFLYRHGHAFLQYKSQSPFLVVLAMGDQAFNSFLASNDTIIMCNNRSPAWRATWMAACQKSAHSLKGRQAKILLELMCFTKYVYKPAGDIEDKKSVNGCRHPGHEQSSNRQQ